MEQCKQCNGVEFVEDRQRGDEICIECGTVKECQIDLNWFQKYEYPNNEMTVCMQKCTQTCIKKNVFIQTEDDDETLTKEAQSIQTQNPMFSILTCCVLSICQNENECTKKRVCIALKFPMEKLQILKKTGTLYVESVKNELQHICNVNQIMSKPYMQELRKRTYVTYKNPKMMAQEIFRGVYYQIC